MIADICPTRSGACYRNESGTCIVIPDQPKMSEEVFREFVESRRKIGLLVDTIPRGDYDAYGVIRIFTPDWDGRYVDETPKSRP